MLYIHGKGCYQNELRQLLKKQVPASGQAKTIQGELVRCITRLSMESYRNGNANWDSGFKKLAKYLQTHLCDGTFNQILTDQIKQDVELVIDAGKNSENSAYVHEQEDSYSRLIDRVIEWCKNHKQLLPHTPDPKLKR